VRGFFFFSYFAYGRLRVAGCCLQRPQWDGCVVRTKNLQPAVERNAAPLQTSPTHVSALTPEGNTALSVAFSSGLLAPSRQMAYALLCYRQLSLSNGGNDLIDNGVVPIADSDRPLARHFFA
jgi:hypothetical protein